MEVGKGSKEVFKYSACRFKLFQKFGDCVFSDKSDDGY